MMKLSIIIYIEVVIGFINDLYIALESDGEAFVEIGVISGSLQRDVAFQLSFSDEYATGKTRSSLTECLGGKRVGSHRDVGG